MGKFDKIIKSATLGAVLVSPVNAKDIIKEEKINNNEIKLEKKEIGQTKIYKKIEELCIILEDEREKISKEEKKEILRDISKNISILEGVVKAVCDKNHESVECVEGMDVLEDAVKLYKDASETVSFSNEYPSKIDQEINNDSNDDSSNSDSIGGEDLEPEKKGPEWWNQ